VGHRGNRGDSRTLRLFEMSLGKTAEVPELAGSE